LVTIDQFPIYFLIDQRAAYRLNGSVCGMLIALIGTHIIELSTTSYLMKLFISYARDDSEWVNSLVPGLRDGGVHNVWLDTSTLVTGQDWWLGILTGIEEADCFIAILTPKAVGSIYCAAELRYAYALNKPILPLTLKPDKLIYPDLIAQNHIHATDISGFSLDRTLLLCERSFSFFDRGRHLFQRPDPPPVRPPVPELPKDRATPDQIIDIFALAEKLWAEGNFDAAEKLFLQVIQANHSVSTPAAAERLSRLRYERQRAIDYRSIARLMEDPVLRNGATLLWKSYISNYGVDYDPYHYAQYFATPIPVPVPVAEPEPTQPFSRVEAAPALVPPPTRPITAVNKSESQKLLDIMRDWQRYDPVRRAEAGRRLAEIGDPRPGVGLRLDGLPDILWCEVTGGSVKLGGDKDSAATRRTQEIALPTFYIAKYPITYLQYRAFLIAKDGYTNEAWWQGQQPPSAKGQHIQFANHPRDSLNWFEAMACCQWLTANLGYEITLPTDQQWEKAARGADGRSFPWGNDYISGYANINETHQGHKIGKFNLGTSTAVGLYPQGDSPYGVSDLCGNIWEWTLTEFDNPDCHDIISRAPRTLRGGSWGFVHGFSRSSFRYGHFPISRGLDFGFRVVTTTRPASFSR
jgi:formylglycine-generating enzyme required for sulfatase activity